MKNINENSKTAKIKNQKKNLNKNEIEALNNLKEREDIVITSADKGGALVISDVNDYVKEAERQLSKREHYHKMDHNPTTEHAALVENAIDTLKLNGQLEEKLAEKLKPHNPKTPRMYLLPKVHKPGNPGRPVVSSIGCHTENISKYVDYHLQPLNRALPSYIQDSTDFLKKLDSLPEELPPETIMVTMDVRALYTNVPNNEGIDAVKQFLRTRNRPGDEILSRIISTFLLLILTLNNFVFNDTNYVQVNGASMGTKCAPTYASLFMGAFEQRHFMPKIEDLVHLYVRYIDDIFFLWKGTEEELLKFLNGVNDLHPTIKFDFEYSKSTITFLDSRISLSGGKLKTSIFTKPTDRKAYVHSRSYHPRSTKEAIAYGQALRLRRICTEEGDFWKAAEKLKQDLVKRGYQEQKIMEDINRAASMDQRELRTYKAKETDSRIPFVVTYDNRLPNIKKILEEEWKILQINENESRKFSEKPRLCYKRNRNLRDILGQTRIKNNKVVRRKEAPTKGRCTPCRGRADAKCCTHVVNTNVFTDKTGRKKFDIRQKTGCRSKNAIYLSWCDRCTTNVRQYVGKLESQQANRRINKHRNDVKREDSIAIDKHFREPGHSFDDFRMIIIEEINDKNMTKEQTRQTLLRREDFWVKTLGTLEPQGFNERLNFPSQA